MENIRITDNYAGGNIRVIAQEGNLVKLEQDIRDTSGWWFYWNFRAEADQAQTIVFEFLNGEVIGPWGPAVSMDGIRWQWLGTDSLISRLSFRYSFTEGERVYFSFSLPYQLHHFERFYSRISDVPAVRRQVLTLSEQLRPVPLLVIGNTTARKHIMFTCRHHACESPPSYLLEGLLYYYLSQAESKVLQQFAIHCVPFVDLDGVENGDQGKARQPHDHNRDYVAAPRYEATAAIAEYAKSLELVAGIDLHSPYKWGERNDFPFVVKRGSPVKGEIERFNACLATATRSRAASGLISYSSIHDIEMGEDWNQPNGATCSAFFERTGAQLVFSFELPYFGNENMVISQDNCRQFGADFARALEAYLLQIC